MNEVLRAANIPEEWWSDCYITEDGMIFTPRYTKDGTMTMTGAEAYQEHLEAQATPAAPPPPTLEDRLSDVEAALAEMAYGGGVR